MKFFNVSSRSLNKVRYVTILWNLNLRYCSAIYGLDRFRVGYFLVAVFICIVSSLQLIAQFLYEIQERENNKRCKILV